MTIITLSREVCRWSFMIAVVVCLLLSMNIIINHQIKNEWVLETWRCFHQIISSIINCNFFNERLQSSSPVCVCVCVCVGMAWHGTILKLYINSSTIKRRNEEEISVVYRRLVEKAIKISFEWNLFVKKGISIKYLQRNSTQSNDKLLLLS